MPARSTKITMASGTLTKSPKCRMRRIPYTNLNPSDSRDAVEPGFKPMPLESFPANGTGLRLVTLLGVDRGRHEQRNTQRRSAPTTARANTRCLS